MRCIDTSVRNSKLYAMVKKLSNLALSGFQRHSAFRCGGRRPAKAGWHSGVILINYRIEILLRVFTEFPYIYRNTLYSNLSYGGSSCKCKSSTRLLNSRVFIYEEF